MLFASTLLQFGFWFDDGERWERPMVAPMDGIDRKGSEYLAAAFTRWMEDDPGGLAPAALATLAALLLGPPGVILVLVGLVKVE